MKKYLVSFLILFCIYSTIFSQEILSAVNSSWTTVIPGKVICEPSATSYGFSLITDAQQISAFSNSGKILWEKQLERSRNAFVSTLKDDFFAVVTSNGSKLSLLNPSGCEIWSREIDFQIIDKPFSGRDGRFFIRGSNILECYGINGICRWRIETQEQSNLPVLELNDGSLVIFLKEKNQNKTLGLRVSPFGEILEEITFSGEILKAFSCEQGILLNFTDGTAGLFTVIDNAAQNKWVLLISVNDKTQIQNSTFLVSQNKQKVAFLLPSQNQAEIYLINQKDGSISYSFIIENINGYKLCEKYINNDGILLTDDTSARFYSLEGIDLWNAKLPSQTGKEKYNYTFITQDNHIIFCGENWSLNAYRFSQSSQQKTGNYEEPRDYPEFIKPENNLFALQYTNTIDKAFISEQRFSSLKNGNYGPKEILWLSEMLGNCQAYQSTMQTSDFGTHKERSAFETDTAAVNKMLQQLPLYATVSTVDYTAYFLKNISNSSLIQTLLLSISNNGYDPEGKILDSIEIISSKYSTKSDRLICATCDAVYSICLFMGRPAFNSKGKNILARFLLPDFSIKARTYARNTLKKIADLDL